MTLHPDKLLFERPQFSPLSLAQAAWKQKLPILTVWLLISAGVIGTVLTLPAVYQAEAVILLEAQRIPSNFVAPTVKTDLRDRLSSLRQQVLSHTRLSEMIENFGLYPGGAKTSSLEALVERMRDDIHVELERGYANQPPAFRVGYSGGDPEVVALVASRLASLFIDQDLQQREVEAVSTSRFLDSQLDSARESLEQQEARLSAYKKAHNGELPQQERVLLGELGRLSQQLQGDREAVRQAQLERSLAEASLEEAAASLRELRILVGTVTERAEGNGAHSPARALMASRAEDPAHARLVEQLSTLRQRYTDDHPDVVRAQDAVDQYERARARAEHARAASEPALPALAVRPAARNERSAAFRPDLARREQQVRDLENRIVELNGRIAMLSANQDQRQQRMAFLEGKIANLPLREQDLAALVRDYEISRANYQSLLRKKMDADLATEMERRQKSDRFILLDAPRVPEEPVKPQRLLLGLLGSAGGLLFGVIVGIGRELKNDVLLGEWELNDEIKILGRVPQFSVVAAGSPDSGARRESPARIGAGSPSS